MIQSTEIKPGSYFVWDGELYQAITVDRNKTAMAKMKVAVKVKSPKTGVVKEIGLIGSDRVEEAYVDKREMQYLYNDGTSFVFMDTDTYEQIEIPQERLEWEKNFLRESDMVNITVFNGEILGVELPDKVTLKVAEAEQAVKGNTATSAQKNATLETGLVVKVPLFIQSGEDIVVSTADGKYSGRA
jgi:elongation factor P